MYKVKEKYIIISIWVFKIDIKHDIKTTAKYYHIPNNVQKGYYWKLIGYNEGLE